MYTPPFKITSEMMRLVSEISEQVGIITTLLGDNAPSPMLRIASCPNWMLLKRKTCCGRMG